MIDHKPISGLAEINGAQIYYEMLGSGQPLLLLHAGVADGRMFDDQFPVFAQQYKVLRLDLRGFGRSNMPSGSFANHEDINAILHYFAIDQTHLLGISFGGKIAIDFALAYPQKVTTLILGAPSVGGSQPSERIKQAWAAEDAAFEKGDIDGATEINLLMWVDGPHRRPDEVDPGVRERVRLMQKEIFLKDIPDDIEEIELDPPAAGRLAELKMPVQLLVGDLDLEEKVAQAQNLAAEIANSQLAILPGVAHMLNMEEPATFNKSVLDYLEGFAPQTA